MSPFSKASLFRHFNHHTTCIKAEEIIEFGERFSELGSRSTLIFSFVTHDTDSDFWNVQRHLRAVSQSLSSPQEKKKTTLYLSSVKSDFFSSPRSSQTEPRHAFPMKGKSAVSKLRATSRQIKALITATKLEGGEWLPALDTRPPPVFLTPYNSRQQNT